METIKLDVDDYSAQIDALKVSARNKDTIKGMVSAYLFKALPPLAGEESINAFRKTGIKKIELRWRWRREVVGVMLFTPDCPANRMFLFLSNPYPGGVTSPI